MHHSPYDGTCDDLQEGYKDDRRSIDTRFRRKAWEVIVEPLFDVRKLEVITACEVWDDDGEKTR